MYNNEIEQLLIETSNRINIQFKNFIQADQKLQRQDTLKGILYLIEQYRKILVKTSMLNAQQRAKNYHIVYNTITYIVQISHSIQKSNFCFQTIKPLIQCILCLESNLILSDIKYLDKRTQLYLIICKIYEQGQYYQPIIYLLQNAIRKYEDLKKIYQLDSPVPKYVQDILDNNLTILKIMSIKISIQSGIINVNDWKKRVDQQFKDNMQRKLLCLIQCLRTETKKNSNIFVKNTKLFKESLVQQGYDLIKPHLDILSRGLKQMKQKIEFQITYREKTMTNTLKQQQINQQIKKKRQLIGKHIKQSDLKKASKAFPLEYHAQLIYYAYQTKNYKVIQQLLRCGMIRIQCRRIQVPYVTDVKIEVSNTPHVNAKQGYQKIPIDLNEANLKQQLKKLRKSGKRDPNAKLQVPVQQPQVAAGKDAKKGGKQVLPPVQKKQKNSDQPTEWQLEQINHKYVFLYIKRSLNPEKAIYGIQIVLGHEQKGPVGYEDTRRIIVPYIQKNQKVIASEIEQYKGMRESTQMVPYIILYHSENSLQNQEQRKNLITDVEPVIGKNPMIPCRLGYTKINMDLRQVPQEFIKTPGQSYIYLSYKTDYQFHISSRLIEIFNALVQLQNSFSSKKQNISPQFLDKYIQLDIKYSLQKLDQFFLTLQQCLKGLLGQQFYIDKNDFLTNLVFQVWKKYLKNPLQQIDYIMQQRLNEQIIDHDYNLYKEIINKCKPIFLRGLKVLNLIMVNNKKCDILLLSKINLELIKLLEENRQYYLASQNARLALDRIRIYRDQYLTKSVQALNDKLLPFAITSSNFKLKQTFTKMKNKFLQQRLLIEKINKIRQRKRNGKNPLSQQQLLQAELQWKLNRIPDEYDEAINKLNTKHSQVSSLLASVDLDLSNIYFRVSLKHGDQLKKKGINHSGFFPADQLYGLADTLVKKLGFLQTKANQKQAHNLKDLQTTLIKAQKLPPPKPQASRPQKRLLQESYKNPYKLSLLLLNLGALNSINEDKKYYLKESLKSLIECKKLEQRLLQNCVENSIFIFSSMFQNQINPESKATYKTRPFEDLYNGVWPCQGEKPQPPILVGKTSSSIYLKLPPFIYKDKKNFKQIHHMKLYGKISANGVDVSTNCDQLMGTGIKQSLGKIVRVSHLSPNNYYCFAVAPLNHSTGQLLQIGKTSMDTPTFNPYPISSIASNLAKVAYQIGQYDIAQQASKMIVTQYTEQSKIIDPKTDNLNKIFKFKLNQQKLIEISLLQIRSIAQSLYILSLCEKRKLAQMRNIQNINILACQEKQRQIVNLISLCSSLQPSLPCPINSLTFILNNSENTNYSLFEGYMLSLFNKDYLCPKLRKSGVKILRKIMEWGLQNNQINLSRKIIYKWAQRKWIVLGKMIQVQEKKQIKKGGKDPKQTQQQKMVDKFCHFMIQKSPLIMEQFEDNLINLNDEYSDLLANYIENIKQYIQQLAQSMDNGPEKGEQILNNLNSKLQLAQYMKDPLNSIGKINNNLKFYIEYNTKIMRRALEVSSKTDLKILAQKIQDFSLSQPSEQVKYSLQIFELMNEAFQNDIQFSPESKNWVKFIMQKTGKNLSKTIQIYDKYEQKIIALTKSLKSKSFSFTNKYQDYDYQNLWLSQINHLKALSLLMSLQGPSSFKIEYKVKPIYTSIQFLNLQNLVKKKKQIQVLGSQKCQLDAASISIVQKIFKNIAISIYSSYCIQNWIKLINQVTLLLNFINFYQITPFYHEKSKCYVYLSVISLIITEMLKKIKFQGPNTYKVRYNKKLQNTQLQSILIVLKSESSVSQNFQPLYDQYVQNYYIPQLSNSATKDPWFNQYSFLNIQSLSSMIVYTIQSLFVKQKNQIIINILRQFCNVTEHSFSLDLLPVMIQSQQKINQTVQQSIMSEENKLREIQQHFQNQKKKHKKKRTAQITGQKMQYQIQYEENKKKVLQTLDLLKQEKNFISTQKQASKVIIAQIQRDYNKATLNQKQQKKYVIQFGQDQQNLFNKYIPRSQVSSINRQPQGNSVNLNKLNILSKNRKNILKDLINKYEQIYQKLRNNKTSKDPMAQILNRNEVGNLCYALVDTQSQKSNIDQAFEFWNDSLANIFRKVNPIDNYPQILQENGSQLVNNIGFKQLLLSLCIIYKVSNFCCHNNINLQRKCIQFTCSIVLRIFQTSLTHPQCLHAFSNYRLKSFEENTKYFYQQQISLEQLSCSLEHFILKSLDIFDDYSVVKVLPLTVFFQYLVIDISKKIQLSIKAKIYKSMALSRCGEIKMSSLNLLFISQEKDLPIMWLQKSDNLKKQKGQNWYPQIMLINQSKPFLAPQIKQSIQAIKNINFPSNANSYVNLQIPVLFNIAKNLILFKIYEQQICQNIDLNEQRITNLKQIQLQIRQSLKKLSNIQECQRLKQKLDDLKTELMRNGVQQELQKSIDKKKSELQAYMKTNSFEDGQISNFMNKRLSRLRRLDLIDHIIRTRYFVHKINLARNIFINCFYIIKNAITNFNRYSYGARRVESGYDPQIQISTESLNQQTGKKDDKKGGKKQTEPAKITKQQIDPKQEQRLKKQCLNITKRNAPNAFWHIKLTFQLGCLLYRQNNFLISLKIFEQMIKNCQKYGQVYYSLFGLSYIQRCKIRLGQMQREKIIKIIGQVQAHNFDDWNYISLVIDFGQIFNNNLSLQLYFKGLQKVKKLWEINGMIKYLAGINMKIPKKKYGISDQLTAQQQDIVKKKSKKQQKKAGKQQKKAPPKKDDGKKKKEQSKIDYKPNPLKIQNQVNLFEEDEGGMSNNFRQFTLQKHPNFHSMNIYKDIGKKYIKCFYKYWQQYILRNSQNVSLFNNQCFKKIQKLLKIAQNFPENNIQKVQLLNLKSSILKKQFLYNFNKYIKSLTKQEIKKLKLPFEDLPRNQKLNNIPTYFKFLTENSTYLNQAQQTYKKLILLLPSIPFILQNDQQLHIFVYEYSYLVMLEIQYNGPLLPKYSTLNDQTTALQEKKTNRKLLVSNFIKLIKYAIDLCLARKRLNQEYYTFSKKQLDANCKIDEDISLEIKNIDKQCKNVYPLFLKQVTKSKQSITSLDLLSYMLKLRRQSQVMTLSNPLQNSLRKSYRILSSYLSSFKEKCLVPLPDFQKPQKQVSHQMLMVKSKRIKTEENNQFQSYIYILGNAQSDQGVVYGKFNIQMNKLSRLLENCYKIQSKLKQSSTQSQAIKQRNYKQLQQPFSSILKDIISCFCSLPTDSQSFTDILSKKIIKLSQKSILILINLLNGQCNEQNEEFNNFLNQTHILKYKLKEEKQSNNMMANGNISKIEKTIEQVK